jgi:predicted outer membrane repeat protein
VIRIATALTRPTMVSRSARIAARLPTNIAITFMSNISCHWENAGGAIVEKFAAYLSRRSSKTKELNMAELRDQILIKAAPAKVYPAIATQAGLRDR